VLYNFHGPDGATPLGGLIRDAQDNFYGTTFGGGNLFCDSTDYGCGTVFKLTPSGRETVLYRFSGGADGRYPAAALVRDAQGNLYGTTKEGGDLSCDLTNDGCGTVFRVEVTPNGTETVLYTFTGGADGGYPVAALVRDEQGNLYGTTEVGGLYGQGTVFMLTPTGTETVLYNFSGPDGAAPMGGLIRDAQGNFYGTTEVGGLYGQGTVFMLTPTGTETVLYTFTGGADGGYPVAALVRDEQGNLYGTTDVGGNSPCFPTGGCGTVFKVSPAGIETVLYAFTGGTDGQNPSGSLILDSQGNLYGTTNLGGDLSCNSYGCGTVFEVIP